MSLEMCNLLFIHVGVDLRKKLLENALRHETAVVLNVLPSLCRKCRLTGFRINVFKNNFSVHHFVFVIHIRRSKHGRNTTAQASLQ